jgi:hypothetical protein
MNSTDTYYALCEEANMLNHCHPVNPSVLVERLRDRGGRADLTPEAVRRIVADFAATSTDAGTTVATAVLHRDGTITAAAR